MNKFVVLNDADVEKAINAAMISRFANCGQICVGVERVFAIQAGRELRVMVEPDKVSDGDITQLSEAVARRIEGELQYPGQIQVVVVRETRAVDFAR